MKGEAVLTKCHTLGVVGVQNEVAFRVVGPLAPGQLIEFVDFVCVCSQGARLDFALSLEASRNPPSGSLFGGINLLKTGLVTSHAIEGVIFEGTGALVMQSRWHIGQVVPAGSEWLFGQWEEENDSQVSCSASVRVLEFLEPALQAEIPTVAGGPAG